jgi:hypothetical protein
VYACPAFCSRLTPLRNRTNTRYGWVAGPYPTGTRTRQETPSFARRYNVKATATQGPLARPWGLVPSSTRALGSQVSRLLDGSGLRAPGRCAELAACADPKAAAGGDSAFFSALPKPPACPGCALRCRWRGAHVFSGPRLTTNWLPSPTFRLPRPKARLHGLAVWRRARRGPWVRR